MLSYRKCATVLTVLMLITILFSAPVKADIEIENIPETKVGDYFEYDLEEKITSESLAKKTINELNKSSSTNISFEKVSNISEEPVLKEVIGKDTISVHGDKYNTKISRTTINITFDITPEEGHFSKMNMNISLEIKTWQSSKGTVKERTEMFQDNIYENYTQANITYLYKKRTINTIRYEEPKQGLIAPIEVGKSWNNTVNRTTITNQTSWEKAKSFDDQWTKIGPNVKKKTGSVTTNYDVQSEINVSTKIGDFECLKLKSYRGDDEENFTNTYLSKEGIQVKTRQYGEQREDIRMILTDYKYQNLEKDKKNDPETLEDYWWAIIAGTAGIIFGLSLAYSKRGKGKEKYETGTAEGYDRYHPEGKKDDSSSGSK